MSAPKELWIVVDSAGNIVVDTDPPFPPFESFGQADVDRQYQERRRPDDAPYTVHRYVLADEEQGERK